MGKKDAVDTRGLQDVEMYLNQIKAINKSYTNLVAKLDAIKKNKKKVDEKMELMTERESLKQAFIAKKKACRANISLLPENLSILKDRELKELQEAYRDIDADFKALGVMVERNTLLDGAASRKSRDGLDVSRATNDELLDKARSTQQDTTSKLRDGLSVLESTKETAKLTAAQLEESREKMQRISKGLDEVESELEISRKLLTRFVKRIYTDKIIIAFTALIVCGIVGIIVYATMNPNQTTFNVPDVLKPPSQAELEQLAKEAEDAVKALLSKSPSPSPSSEDFRRLLRGF